MTSQLYMWLAMLLFLLGMLALVVEIIILPGFGVAGVAGILLIAWGVLLLAVDFTQATTALVVALSVTLAAFVLGIRVFGKYNLWQRMTLRTKQRKDDGYLAPRSGLARHGGKAGTALTPLRPSGTAEVSGERLDVVTEGEYIAAGTAVEVIRVEGGRVIVRALDGLGN